MKINPVWPFTRQVLKLGYINNPFWTETPADSTKHSPCGYWHGGGDLNPVTQRIEDVVGFVNTTGRGDEYQLGFGNSLDLSTLMQATDMIEVKQTIVGNNSSIILDNNNRLWVVGSNIGRALGIPGVDPVINWTCIDGLWKYVATSISQNHTVAIKTDGTVWVVGLNYRGQLGLGDIDQRDSFTHVDIGGGWTKVACGHEHTLLLNDQGDLYATGNFYGGTGFPDQKLEFTKTLGNVSDISTAFYHSLALRGNYLWVTGKNANGQLGLGNTNHYLTWQKVTGIPQVISVETGNGYGGESYGGISFIIDIDNKLYGAGSNKYHILGLSDLNDKQTFTFVLDDALQVSGNKYSTLLIKKDRTLWGVGRNYSGELGLGDNIARTSFEQIGSREWIDICMGKMHSIANNWDGKYYWE